MTDGTGGIEIWQGEYPQTPDLEQGSQREPGPEGQGDTPVPIPHSCEETCTWFAFLGFWRLLSTCYNPAFTPLNWF